MTIIYSGLAKNNHINAVKCFSQGNYKEASEIWESVLEKQENDITAIKGLACCYFLEDKIREARSLLEDSKSLAATDPEITNLIVLCLLKEGKVQQAIETILDAQELLSHPLLNQTLDKIKNLNNPDHVVVLPLKKMIRITLPRTQLIPPNIISGIIKFGPVGIGLFFVLFIFIFYPNIRNSVTALNIRNRGDILAATSVTIKDIDTIVNARENYKILLQEDIIVKKFNELKKAISDQHPNKARILVNELLASNAGLAVKERVSILESFIIDSSPDNIDYVPRYAEIAVAPTIYQDILIRWQGTVANIYHQGRTKTTFDLLVNFVGNGQVEGIANVELEGLQEYNNGNKVTVIGKIKGITKDNRIIVEGIKIITY